MMPRIQKIMYKFSCASFLMGCLMTSSDVMAAIELTREERIALEKDVDIEAQKAIEPTPLITLESIAAKSGDLLGIPKGKQAQDSIAKAMASAYNTNPEIKSQRSALRAADENVVQARAGWRPTVNAQLSSGISKTRNFGSAVNNTSSTGGSDSAQVTVNQNIFNGGATVAQTESAKAAIKAQRAALLDVEQKTLFAAVQAYLNLIGKLAQLEVLRANEGFLKTTLQSTRDKFEVGEETRTSVAQAEGQYADGVARRQTAEAELEGLKATYEQIVGRPAGKLDKPVLPKYLPKTIEEALDKARLNNPAILQRQFNEISARRRVDQINGGLLPSVSLQAQSNVSSSETNSSQFLARNGKSKSVNHQATVNIAIPLYEAGSTRSQKRQAIETAEQNRIEIETQRRAIEQQLIQAFANLNTARSNVKYYSEQVQANEISVQGTKQEMLVGSKILLDLLDAQQRLLNAQQALVQVEQNMYLAAYQVLQLMGMLTAKTMQLQVEYYDHKAHYNEIKYAF